MPELDTRNGLPAWDPKANAARVVFDVAELESRFRSGELQLVADHQYPLVGPDGSVYDTPASSIPDALKDGYHFATAEDVARAEARTAGGGLRAAADGALDGITFGFGGAIQAGMGADELGLRMRREEHPLLHGAGMVGGAVLPALLTDGASLGAMAEAGAARVIGAEAAATTLGRMAATAAGGAAEGAAFGVGDQVTESVLGDTPLAAESLIASGAHGAFWGGAVGAVLGRALGRGGEAERAAQRGELETADTILDIRPSADEINAALERQAGEAPPRMYGQKLLDFIDKHGASQLEAGGAAPELVRVFAEGSPAERASFLERALTPKSELEARTRALKEALEARIANHEELAMAGNLERDAESASRVHADADAELKRLQLEDGDRMYPEVERRKAEAASALADTKAAQRRWAAEHEALDSLRSEFGISADGVVDEGRLSSFVSSITRPRADARMASLRNLAGNDARVNALLDDIGEVQGAANLVRDQLAREQAAGMDLELMAGVAGHGIGGGFAGALMGRNIAQSFTRPLHAALGRYRVAAQVQRVHGYVREALDRFVAGPAARGVEAVRRSGIDRKLAPTTLAMLDGNRDERRTAVQARIAELSALTPDTLVDSLDGATRVHGNHAPDVSAVVRQRLMEAHEFLRQVLPQSLATAGAGGMLVPRAGQGIIPDRDIRRFANVDAAIQDPLRIVDAMAEGRVPDPAAVTAVQTLYPALWGRMVGELSEALARNPDAVGWKQALSLSITLGLDSHPAFNPLALNLQQALAKPAPKQPMPASPVTKALGRAADKSLTGAAATLTDHIMERGARR